MSGEACRAAKIAIELHAACEQAGLKGCDATSAVEAYLQRGPLGSDERAHLDAQASHERYQWLSDRYGSDAVRVAAIAFANG